MASYSKVHLSPIITLSALICPSEAIPPFTFSAPVVLLVEAVVDEIVVSFEKVFAPDMVCVVSIVTYLDVITFPAPSWVALVADEAFPERLPIATIGKN